MVPDEVVLVELSRAFGDEAPMEGATDVAQPEVPTPEPDDAPASVEGTTSIEGTASIEGTTVEGTTSVEGTT